MTRASTLLLAAALPLAGCARDDGIYPSLAPRPIEKLAFEEPEVAAPAPAAPDPALDVELAAATARLDKAAADFARDQALAEAAARKARGAAAGDEAWINAQTALAELDVARAETSGVLTDLEQLAIARAATLAPAYPALDAARDRARGEMERQEAAIARIGSGLAPA